jgi:pimeloyl-ACP methyl ester carboxylesterase
MKRAYAEIPEGQIHYRYAGSGEAVILLHMSGSSSDEYEKVGDIIARYYRVYAIDFLGFGESDNPPHFYSFADHARTIISFMDSLGVKAAYLVGNLVGANIAVHVATSNLERVKGLMLGQLCYHEDPEHFLKLRHAPIFSKVGISDDGSHMKEYWMRSAKYGDSAEISNDRAVCLHKARDNGEALHWALCEDENFEKRLPQIKAPTVCLNYSKNGNVDGIKKAASIIPGGKYKYLEDASPYINRANPERFASLFLESFK